MKNLTCIHGLKGLCGLLVTMFHYLLAFAFFGYVGWGAPVTAAAEKWDYYFQYFPYSILTNYDFPLYIFFALITFLPATIYFTNRNPGWVKRQAVVRYGRFFPYIALGALFGFLAIQIMPTQHITMGNLIDNSWVGTIYGSEVTLWSAVKQAFTVTFVGNGEINNVLWCFNYIFLGSYLAYAFLLLFGNANHRGYLYLALGCLSFYDTNYTSFLAGLVAADLLSRENLLPKLKKWSGFLVVMGILLGLVPEVFYPSSQEKFAVYAVGIFLILVGIGASQSMMQWLSNPRLVTLGKYAFALIMVQFPVMTLVSIPQFLYTYPTIGYGWSLALVAITAVICNGLAAVVFDKIAASLSKKLSKKLENLFLSR